MFGVIAPIAAIPGGVLVVRISRRRGVDDLTDLAGVEGYGGDDG
jgi:hypothetical protein